MLHILRLEGEPLQVDIEEIGTVIDLKRHLKRRHDYPICLQQLLHEHTRLDNSIRLASLLQDRDVYICMGYKKIGFQDYS